MMKRKLLFFLMKDGVTFRLIGHITPKESELFNNLSIKSGKFLIGEYYHDDYEPFETNVVYIDSINTCIQCVQSPDWMEVDDNI